MEEQFQKYLSRKRESIALSTTSNELDVSENDRTDDKRFNPTPPPILTGQTVKQCCLKQNEVVISENEVIFTKINLSKIPNTQLEKETAKIKLKYHIRRLRIARRLIQNQSLLAKTNFTSNSLIVDSTEKE